MENLKKDKDGRAKSALTRLLFALLIFVLASCEISIESKEIEDNRFEVVTVDSCEYVVFDDQRSNSGSGGITHKENCSYCKSRGE